MKNYRQLKEKLADLVNDRKFGTKNVPVYVNPTSREWSEIAKADHDIIKGPRRIDPTKYTHQNKNHVPLRGFFTRDLDLYVWHGEAATHEGTRDKVYPRGVMFVSGFMQRDSRNVIFYAREPRRALDFMKHRLDPDPDEANEIVREKNPSVTVFFDKHDMDIGFG